MRFHKYAPGKIPAFIVLLLIPAFRTDAQQSSQDSTFYTQTTDSLIALYKNEIKGNLLLYNGSEYAYTGHNVKGFPYFESADMLTGSVYYDGNLYNNVAVYYDLVNDELVILDYTKNFPVKLVADKVSYFIIDDYRFINSNTNSDLSLAVAGGFYQELYKHKTGVYAKKEKRVQLPVKAEDNEAYYQQKNKYFIHYDGKVYEVSTERSVLNVFKKRADELKKFVHANKINFKKNFEDAVVKTTQYFDQIGN